MKTINDLNSGGEFGFHVRWIGARFSVGSEQVSVSIPEDKVSDLLERTNDLLALTTCSKRKLRSFCGSLSFVSGLVCFLRPFASALWAALSSREVADGDVALVSQSGPAQRKQRLPTSMVFVKQFRHALVWLHSFFMLQVGPLERAFPYRPDSSADQSRIAIDACPGASEKSCLSTLHVLGTQTNCVPMVRDDLMLGRDSLSVYTRWGRMRFLWASGSCGCHRIGLPHLK